MTIIHTEHQPWMSTETITDLENRRARLITEIQEAETTRDELTTAAKEAARYVEQRRKELREATTLLEIAQGRAPIPTRDEVRITEDGLGVQFGKLRICGIPEDAPPAARAAFAEVMDTIAAAVINVARRAKTGGQATEPPAEPEPTEPPRGETPMRTVWGAYLYGPDVVDLGVEDTPVEARARAITYLDDIAVTVPPNARWQQHGSHREVLTVDGQPLKVEHLSQLLDVVIAAKDIPAQEWPCPTCGQPMVYLPLGPQHKNPYAPCVPPAPPAEPPRDVSGDPYAIPANRITGHVVGPDDSDQTPVDGGADAPAPTAATGADAERDGSAR